MCAISATARSKAALFAAEGLVVPLTLRTNCSAAACTSSLVAGGSKLCRVRMLRHMFPGWHNPVGRSPATGGGRGWLDPGLGGGGSDDQGRLDQRALWLGGGISDALQQGPAGGGADDLAAVVDRGDLEVTGLRKWRVVIADQRDVRRHAQTVGPDGGQRPQGHGVVRGEDGGGLGMGVEELGRGSVAV